MKFLVVSCWFLVSEKKRRQQDAAQPEMAVLLGLAGFLAGADFLPAAGAAVGLQNFFAEADGFWSDFHEFVVGDEFDRLLQIQLPERNESNRFIRG